MRVALLLLLPITSHALEVGDYRRITPAVTGVPEIRRITEIRPGPDRQRIIHDSAGDDNYANVWEKGEVLNGKLGWESDYQYVLVEKKPKNRTEGLRYELSVLRNVIVDKTGKTVALDYAGNDVGEIHADLSNKYTVIDSWETLQKTVRGLPIQSVTVTEGTMLDLGVTRWADGGPYRLRTLIQTLDNGGLTSPQVAESMKLVRQYAPNVPESAYIVQRNNPRIDQIRALNEIDAMLKPKVTAPALLESARASARSAIESAR